MACQEQYEKTVQAGLRWKSTTYQFIESKVALWICIVLVLIFVFSLLQGFLKLLVVIAFKICLKLRCECFCKLSSLALYFILKTNVADCVLDHSAILLESPISERTQVLERLERESTMHVEIVVVEIVLCHMLSV